MYQNRVRQSVLREQLNISCDYNEAHFPLNTKCDLLVIYQEVEAHGQESKKVSKHTVFYPIREQPLVTFVVCRSILDLFHSD